MSIRSGLLGIGGSTVLVGEVDGDAAALRLKKRGAIDPTFGGAGGAVVPFAGGDSRFRSVTRQRDGKLVAVGSAPANLVVDGFAVARLQA